MAFNTLRRGFTMIELLVVIVIIGILASAMTPVVLGFIERAAHEDARNDLRLLAQAANNYKQDTSLYGGGGYPSAGGVFTKFGYYDNGEMITLDGRARGWVYFEHSGCPREKGDDEARSDIGDGNGDGYGLGMMGRNDEDGENAKDRFVNEAGCCLCFDADHNEGGLGAKPANWQDAVSGVHSAAQVAIMNGCLFEYLGNDLDAFTNGVFEDLAVERFKVPRDNVHRAYAMNIVTGADRDLYETDNGYGAGSAINDKAAICAGRGKLIPYEDSSSLGREADYSQLALFVELDVDNAEMGSANSLAGDQVWDWDEGNESMGFIHDRDGMMYAFVAFADGHVEEIRDPSGNTGQVDEAKRRELSKYYGSAGQNRSGKKWD